MWSAGGAGAGREEQAARGSALGEPGWAWRAQQTAGDGPQPKGGGAHTGNARGQPTSAEGLGPASITPKIARSVPICTMEDIGTKDDRAAAQWVFILSGVPSGMGVSTENSEPVLEAEVPLASALASLRGRMAGPDAVGLWKSEISQAVWTGGVRQRHRPAKL